MVRFINHIAIARADIGQPPSAGQHDRNQFLLGPHRQRSAALLAALAAVALALAIALYLRLKRQNRRLIDAADNTSQGLCMFDPQGHMTVVNARYIEMYALSPAIVRPGCPPRTLIQHRKDTGFFQG